DVYLLHAGRHNPKSEFLDKAWGEVFAAFEKSGVIEELWKLVPGQDKAAARGDDEDEDGKPNKKAPAGGDLMEKIGKLVKKVRWGDSTSQEWVTAARLRANLPEFVALMRVPSGRADDDFAGVQAILQELKKNAGDSVSINDSERSGAKLSTLRVKDAPIVLTV